MIRLTASIFLFLALKAGAQEYNYIHYNTKDGLAGSTVYRMCQDKKGYLWFATDNGISKFDGKKFTNFTTEDGLTDNEVLFIRNDSKGRVWIMPFNKTVCYYYEGQIYNSTNDTILRNARFTSNAVMTGESAQGEVYFITSDALFGYQQASKFRVIADFREIAARYAVNPLDFVPADLTGQFPHSMVLFNHHAVFVNRNDSFVYYKDIKSDPSLRRHFLRVDDNLEMVYPKAKGFENFNSVSRINKEYSMYNTPNGAWMVDNAGNVSSIPFLPGKKISYSFSDSEGNLWFSTLGEGVYRLTSQSMKTFAANKEVFCIEEINNSIYCGLADGRMPVITDLELQKEHQFDNLPDEPKSRRLYCLKKTPSGALYKGFDSHLSRTDRSGTTISGLRPIKALDVVDEDHLVVCTNYLTLKLRASDLKAVDTIWRERGTKVIYDRGHYYIGTLNGLVIVDTAGKVKFNSAGTAVLNKRIVDMCKTPEGDLWIATNDNGVLLYANGRIDTIINSRNGLSSNICRSVFLDGQFLWVGTNRGINKIDTRQKKVLARYGISDGLASESINAVYSRDGIVWVGSPAGLTYFKEADMHEVSICKLDLHTVVVAGKKVAFNLPFHIPYRDNNIIFDFAAISFKSGPEITYHYKMDGLDGQWQETKLDRLTYPSLPPGDYKLQLYAVNKFGKSSDLAVVNFSVLTPFWKSNWFWIVVVGLSLGMVYMLTSRRYKHLQRRVAEKNELTRRLTELEQASLRAQMNPHFIFNCLNSLQHFIMQNDFEQTNRYIFQFSRLIRQTLDYTSSANVTIADEMKYLSSYLELEQMRFPSTFEYQVTTDPSIQSDFLLIPSMLIQPFVENAIRHGIRNKQEGPGRISIQVRRVDQNILFCIEDNGVGREAAATFRSSDHVEYQSKGITLTRSRIEIINSSYLAKITMNIIDLMDKDKKPCGTRVELLFPIEIIDKLD